MSFSVTLLNSNAAANTISWTPTTDIVITSFQTVGASAKQTALSTDPSVTVGQYTNPTVTSVDDNLIAWCSGQVPPIMLNIPISAGRTLYVAYLSACSAMITFEYPVAV